MNLLIFQNPYELFDFFYVFEKKKFEIIKIIVTPRTFVCKKMYISWTKIFRVIKLTISGYSLDFFSKKVFSKAYKKIEKIHINWEKSVNLSKNVNSVIFCAHRNSTSSATNQESLWTKHDLEACLEVYWRDVPMIRLDQLIPEQTTTKEDATACFMLLLG